jgi:hypothetical protein
MTKRGLRVFGVVAVMLVLAAGIALSAGRQTSAARRQMNFPHAFHVKDQSLNCEVCHTKAAASTTGADDLLPRHEQCNDCHDVNSADGCKKCHLAAKPVLSERITGYSAKFDHQRHLSKGKLNCDDCHKDLDGPLPGHLAGHLPKMDDCVSCHNKKMVKVDCNVCHLATDDLKPKNHKLDWTHLHGASASAADATCDLCHQTDYCQKCHNGDPTFSPHPRNYVTRHGHDAHLADTQCSVCHDDRSFCNACHRQMNVLPVGHFKPGWVTPDGGHHTDEAGADLESCIACHDSPNQTPVCARCHKK